MNNIYETKTFFEYISSADMELIHSQMIAWILTSDFQGFNDRQESQSRLLRDFFGIADPGEVKLVATEQSSIDILVDLGHTVLCIENKIKSSQHSDQLKKYQEHISKNYIDKVQKFYFLTLIEEAAESEKWVNKSYKELLKVLNSLKQNGAIADNFNGQLLQDYMLTLEKLLSAINAFLAEPGSCQNVFTDGGIKKAVKTSFSDTDCHLQLFIRANQLETFFQKIYFREASKHIGQADHVYVNETNGNGILGAFLITHKEVIKDHSFHLGVDFQDGRFKTMCISTNYPKSSKKDMLPQIIELFDDIHRIFPQYGYLKSANKPKTRAQCSVTKPFNITKAREALNIEVDYWWQLTPEQFAIFYNQEMELSRILIYDYILKAFEGPLK